MQDLLIMQRLQPSRDIYQGLPYLILSDSGLRLEVLVDDPHEIPSLCKFKHNAKVT